MKPYKCIRQSSPVTLSLRIHRGTSDMTYDGRESAHAGQPSVGRLPGALIGNGDLLKQSTLEMQTAEFFLQIRCSKLTPDKEKVGGGAGNVIFTRFPE